MNTESLEILKKHLSVLTESEEAFIRKANALPEKLLRKQIELLKSKAIFTPTTNETQKNYRDLMVSVVIALETMMTYFGIVENRKKVFNDKRLEKKKLKEKGIDQHPNSNINAI